MDEPIDESYFKWLYSQVGSLRTRAPLRTHWSLLRQLYQTEFVWFVPNDDNRVADGLDLRHEFFLDQDLRGDFPEWEGLECSVLEMLIGVSRRLSFEAEGEPRWWFWHLLENLELTHYNDAHYDPDNDPYKFAEIEATLERLIFRQYDYSGHGGLFPLEHAEEDQTQVEIWYQLNAYIVEREEG